MWKRSDYNGSLKPGVWHSDPPRTKGDAHDIVRRWEREGLRVLHEEKDLIVVMGFYDKGGRRAGEVYITVWRRT